MHRHLPWCTVYVTLTALDGSNTADSSASGMYVTTSTPSSVVEMSANASTQAAANAVNIKSPSEGFLQAGQENSDDIRMPLGEEDSRSFLCMVNSAGCVIKWLGYELLDESNMQVMNPSAAMGNGAAFGSDAASPWMQMYPQFYPQQQATDPDAMATQQQQWMAYQQWVMMMQAQAAQYQHQQQHAQDQQTIEGDAAELATDAGVAGDEEPDAKRVKTEEEVHDHQVLDHHVDEEQSTDV